MRVMKTREKRKDVEIDGPKKMRTMTVHQVEVVLVLVLVVVAQGKKRRFEVDMVEIVARVKVAVAVLVLEGNLWKEGEICLIRFLRVIVCDSYVNMPIVFGDLFLFFVVFCFFSICFMRYILFCSSTTRREEIDVERKRVAKIKELKLL